ncbi:MAG: hypothetical protein JRH10_16470 [Deltaproteobacteria bacterium]|nr:hypothetical protein [Deltaproteobacteria bacterium]
MTRSIYGFVAPVLLALLALGVTGCSGRRASHAVPTGAEHAVHTERLLGVMRGLDRLTEERPAETSDLEAANEASTAELVETARAIAASAEQIPQAAWSYGSLTTPERAAFHRRAATLRELALGIARDAEHMRLEQQVQAAWDLRDACDGCHSEFRGPRKLEP